jgi:hypothetical protein
MDANEYWAAAREGGSSLCCAVAGVDVAGV